MPNDLIRYDLLVQEALCGVVKKVLADAAKHGLPGDHHFYITFRTHAPGVRLSNRMRELYPEEMTIILQHQFEDLRVTDQAFEVGLSFKGIPEMLLIPFEALTGFLDPSVQFSAKFEPQIETGDAGDGAAAPSGVTALPRPIGLVPVGGSPPMLTSVPKGEQENAASRGSEDQDGEAGEEAKVVSIDAFRKKT